MLTTDPLILFLSGALSGLLGAAVTAAFGYFSMLKQIQFERKKYKHSNLFNARREAYEEYLDFANTFIVKRSFGESTLTKDIGQEGVEARAEVVSRATLHCSDDVREELYKMMGHFDKPTPTPDTQAAAADRKAGLQARDELIDEMRIDLDLPPFSNTDSTGKSKESVELFFAPFQFRLRNKK